MDFIIELLLELIFEGGMELSTNKKIPNWLRYPLIVIILLVGVGIAIYYVLILLLFALVTIGVIIIGILSMKENLLFGIFLTFIGLIMLVSSIKKAKKLYFEKEIKKN